MTFVIALQYVFKGDVIELYTHQDGIEAELIKVWPMFLAYQFFEIVNDQAENVIKGTGMQGTGLFYTAIAYLLLAVPTSYYTAFELEWGLTGVQFGPTVAAIFLAICFNILVYRIDWAELTE